MNRITISLIFLIVISMFLPTLAIMYASGQSTDNSDDSSTGGTTTDNSSLSTTDNSSLSTTDNSSLSTGGGTTTTTTDNSGSSTTGGSTGNSATLPTTSMASNDTVNTADLINSILAVHNRERSAVGVPPLVWNDTLAADAKPWAEHLATTGEFRHCNTATEVCDYHGEGEGLAGFYISNATGEDYGQDLWVHEKKNYHAGELVTLDNLQSIGHYTQMVWKNTTQVGCATASGNGHPFSILDCRYYPSGNYIGEAPY